MRRRRPRLAELRPRLERLRATASYLRSHAHLGRELRLALEEAGSPSWRPAEDLSWRRWIEGQGDAYARRLLAALDAQLDALERGHAARDTEAATDGSAPPL